MRLRHDPRECPQPPRQHHPQLRANAPVLDGTQLARTVEEVDRAGTYNLAGAYRPRRFADVAGQEPVKAVLKAVAAAKSPAQQILLSGTSGTGKTTLARLLAATLLCGESADEPCGECDQCRRVLSGSHPDVVEVDAASHGGVDQIRELAVTSTHAPLLGQWRVFIIDEAHGLTSTGSQAFLKVLEEPPAHAIFILATTDPQKLPLAVRSRCLQLEVLPPDPEALLANLYRVCQGQGWNLDEQTARTILSASDPQLGVRGTLMNLSKLTGLLEQHQTPSSEQIYQFLSAAPASQIQELIDYCLQADAAGAVLKVRQLLNKASAPTLKAQISSQCFERIERASDSEAIGLAKLLAAVEDCGRSATALTVAIATTAALLAPQEAVTAEDPAATPTIELPVGVEAAPSEPAPSSPQEQDEVEPESTEGTRQPVDNPTEATHPVLEEAASQGEPARVPRRDERVEHVFDMPDLPIRRVDPSRKEPASEPAVVADSPATPERRTPTELLNAAAVVSGKAALLIRRSSITLTEQGLWQVSKPEGMTAEQEQLLQEVMNKLEQEGWKFDRPTA